MKMFLFHAPYVDYFNKVLVAHDLTDVIEKFTASEAFSDLQKTDIVDIYELPDMLDLDGYIPGGRGVIQSTIIK